LLVHADPRVQTLEETFGSVNALTCPVHYTGYVAQPAPTFTAHSDEPPLILISIGGGRVGHELIECALAASTQLTLPHRMQVFTGPHLPLEKLAQWQRQTSVSPQINVQHHTTEFPVWLRRAALSVSMAGYNTCMDILAAGVPALVYPFHEHDNDEQTRRARKLTEWGFVKMLEPDALTPESLAQEIMRSLADSTVAPAAKLDLQGATRTAQLLAALINQ
jgi:predicted glycosyltransferase